MFLQSVASVNITAAKCGPASTGAMILEKMRSPRRLRLAIPGAGRRESACPVIALCRVGPPGTWKSPVSADPSTGSRLRVYAKDTFFRVRSPALNDCCYGLERSCRNGKRLQVAPPVLTAIALLTSAT